LADLNSTLNELEGSEWADPDYPSSMVQRIRSLGGIPLREWSTDDLRLVIGQKRALASLLPIALDLLETDPFESGEYYAGDLLIAVAAAAPDDPRVKRLLAAALARLDELDDEDRETVEPLLREAYDLAS
jgi:hypothetical protein